MVDSIAVNNYLKFQNSKNSLNDSGLTHLKLN